MHILKALRDRYQKLNIRSILFIFSVIMVCVFLSLTGYVSYNATTEILLEKLEVIEKTNLKQTDSSLTAAIDEIRRYTINISKNRTILDLINRYKEAGDNYTQKIDMYKAIKSIFDNSNIYYEGIKSVEFYTKEGVISNSTLSARADIPAIKYSDLVKSQIYEETIKSKDSTILIEPGYKDSLLGTFSVPVFGSIVYRDNQEIGYLLIVMQSNWFDKLFGYEARTMILNQNSNSLVWSGDDTISDSYADLKNLIKSDEGNLTFSKNKIKYNVSYMKSAVNNWTILTFSNISEMSILILEVRNYSLLTVLLSLAISFALSRYFSFRITNPIYELMTTAAKFRVEDKVQYIAIKTKGTSFMINVMVYFIAIVVLPVFLYSAVFFTISSKAVQSKVQDSLIMSMNQTINNIDAFMERNQRVSTTIMFDKDVQGFLISTINPGNDSSYEKKVKDVVDKNGALVDNIFETIIYDREGKLAFSTIYGTENSMVKDMYADISKTYGEAFWISYEYDKYSRYVIRLARKIKGIVEDEQYNLKPLGYLLMLYNEMSIETLYEDLNVEGSNVYILDNTGMVISHRSKSMIGKQSSTNRNNSDERNWSKIEYESGEKFLVMYAASIKLPWTLVNKIPYINLKADNQKILLASLYTLLAAFIAAFILSYILSNYFSKLINRLNKNLIKLADGSNEIDFSRDIHINEIKDLAETFNLMARRVLRTIELEKEKKDAELTALQAQINPHFLYNTLESIKWMNKKGEKDNVSTMITALGDLFRLGISRHTAFIQINEEVDYAKAYIDIQKLRYGNKLECFWSVEENVKEYLSPKLILQPLIENSIYHGLRAKEGGGWIKICIYRSLDSIIFNVLDNGLGMDSKQLNKIRTSLGERLTGNSIGIYNVQKRIKLNFGDDYGLTIESSPGQGTSVTVSIPVSENNAQ